MSQSFQILENIAPLVRASSTTITMVSTYLGMPTRITVGGQQYKASSTITLNTAAANGINALDTGTLAANTLYYIYAVQSGGALGIVASTAAPGTGPTGFLAWKEIGRFRTDNGGANINTVVNRLIGNHRNNISTVGATTYTPSFGAFGTPTAVSFEYAQTGDRISIKGVFTSSASTGSAATITLPNSWTPARTRIVGRWYRDIATGSSRKAGTIYTSSPSNVLRFCSDDYTAASTPYAFDLTGSNIAPTGTERIVVDLTDIYINELVGLFD